MVDVTSTDFHTISITDEHGTRQEHVTRYNVADPSANIYRKQLQELVEERRRRGKNALLRPALAGAVSACDEFVSIEHPTMSNRQHFSMCLKGAKLDKEDCDRIAGITDYNDRMVAQMEAWKAQNPGAVLASVG